MNGQDGEMCFIEEEFYLCIFDVMMLWKDGFILVCEICWINDYVFILFFMVKFMMEDKVEGFKVGGDDYLIKFFFFEEFFMCVKVLLKCVNIQDDLEEKVICLGNYVFDIENFMLKYLDFEKILMKKEVFVLKMFFCFKNQVVLRENILIVVWGQDDYFLGRSMDVFIIKLWKYLSYDDIIFIVNIYGIGFKLEVNEFV